MFEGNNLEFPEVLSPERVEDLEVFFRWKIEEKALSPKNYSHNDLYEQWKPGPKTLIETKEGNIKYIGEMPISSEIILRKRLEMGNPSLSASSWSLLNGFLERHIESLKELNEVEFKEFYSRIVKNFGFDFSCDYFPYSSTSGKRIGKKKSISYDDIRNALTFRNKIWFKPYKHSKMVWIEIDYFDEINQNHFLMELETMYIIKHFLGAEPVFVSVPSHPIGSFYMLFKFKEYISDESKKKIEDYFFKRMGFRIRVFRKDDSFYQKREDYIPFPFNKDNLFYGQFNRFEPIRVDRTSILDILDQIENAPEASCKKIEKMIGSIHEGKIIEGERTLGTDGVLTSSLESRAKRFSYGYGTRFASQRALAFWCCYHELNLFQYQDLARSLNDGTSKDMSEWSFERANQELEKYYEYARSTVKSSISEYKKNLGESCSNEIMDRRDVQTILDTDYYFREKFRGVVKIWYNHLYPSKKSQGVWKEHFLRDAEELYKFILRKREYDQETNRTYSDPNFKALEDGTCIPQKIWGRLSDHLRLKTGIRRILNLFEQAGLLVRIKVNGHSFSWKKILHAIHFYTINNLNNLINLYLIALKQLKLGSSSILNYIEEVVTKKIEEDSGRIRIPEIIKVFDSGFS